MYIASARPTDDPSLLAFAGPLMQWHNHGNLCWATGPDGKPRVVGITDANGNCATGVNTGGQNPMVHVWVTPHPCGVFAALEGVGAGQAAVPDDQRVDLCNQPHTHTAAAVPTEAVRPDSADRPRRRSRRHARAAGCCREPRRHQRGSPAAVVGLQGRRSRRVPQHRRRAHRLRALHQVGLDQRRRRPRSRPSREPRLLAAARRFEEVGQRDVLPSRHRGAERRARHRRGADAMAHPRQPLLHQRPCRPAGTRHHQRRGRMCRAADQVVAGADDPRMDHTEQVRAVRGSRGHRRRSDRRWPDTVVRHGPRVRASNRPGLQPSSRPSSPLRLRRE